MNEKADELVKNFILGLYDLTQIYDAITLEEYVQNRMDDTSFADKVLEENRL